MKRENFKPFSKKALFTLFIAFTVTAFSGCSSDDDEPASPDSPDNKVTINADGTASGGAVFHRIDETTFFLDYVKYKIVDSHLEIIGYDVTELPTTPKLYSEVKIDGVPLVLRNLDSSAFKNSNIESITIPSTVTSFGKSCFLSCKLLKSISIPNGVQSISNSCFSGCSSLAEIKIPDSVTKIESYAFWGCYSLICIELPYNLNIIDNAFVECKNLEYITFKNDVPSRMYQGAFSGMNCQPIAYVPKKFVENYKSKLGNYFSEIIGY